MSIESSPRRRDRRRLAVVGFVVLAGLAALGVVWVASQRSAVHPDVVIEPGRPGFLVSVEELRERARLAAEGTEPYASAVADLLGYAADTVILDPRPQEPLEIRGTEGPFVDDSAAAYGLALAWVVSGDETYAQAAARFIMAWVDTTRTTIGTCPDGGGCQTSLIIGRTAPGFVFAADLLAESPALSDADEVAFRSWLATVILPTASVRPNNWGDAGTLLRVVATSYLGDDVGLRAALDQWFAQQDLVAADGHIPPETRRGPEGIMYTQEALQYRVAAAVVAERHGLDLWAYQGAGGATLWDAIDYLASYWSRPDAWPWDEDAETPSTGPLWEIAYARSPSPAYQPIILDRRPFGAQGHSAVRWTTLTNGIPFQAAGST